MGDSNQSRLRLGWGRGALMLAMATSAIACADPGTRSFAVTVTDALVLDCIGSSNSPALEQETLDAIAKDLAKTWEKAAEQDPPRPRGRVLLVNELRHEINAWFEPDPGVWDEPYAASLAVYRGEPQEGYLEGVFEDLVSTDEEDEEAGRELCGPRPLARGVLSLTDDDGVLGRIRWTENRYVASVDSSCAGVVACSRDVRIQGLEME